jgi:hypothetical protein
VFLQKGPQGEARIYCMCSSGEYIILCLSSSENVGSSCLTTTYIALLVAIADIALLAF